MKKIIVGVIAGVVIAAGIFVLILTLTNRIMFQLPLLVQQSPKITFIIGDAYFRKQMGGQWEMAIVGRELKNGYELKTEKDSQIDLRFHNGTAVKINENSHVKIDELNVKSLSVSLERGALYGTFEKLFTKHAIQIKTPTAVAGIRGTELGFEVSEKSPDKRALRGRRAPIKKDVQGDEEKPDYTTAVYSLSGITEVYNPKFHDQKVLLSFQNKIKIDANQSPANPVQLTDDEVSLIKSKLNSIHVDEVLFISDKINFDVGSAKILPTSFPELDKIVKIVKEKGVKIRIEGHTDTQGDAAFNQTLSEQRADSIKEYFISKGIKPENLETAGYGQSKPVADNKSERGRSINRRVEFIIVD